MKATNTSDIAVLQFSNAFVLVQYFYFMKILNFCVNLLILKKMLRFHSLLLELLALLWYLCSMSNQNFFEYNQT